MPGNNLRAIARQEKAAEGNRAQAEAAWRAAWWQTTMALAEPTTKVEVSEAIAAVADVLGISRSYASTRRRTGRAVADVVVGSELVDAPPRLAIEWAKARPIDLEAVDALKAAEREGVSLREFAAQLGTTWGDTATQARPATDTQVAAAFGSPAGAERVLENMSPEARANLARAVERHDRRGPGHPSGQSMPSSAHAALDVTACALAVEGDLARLVAAAQAAQAAGSLDAEALAEDAAHLRVVATALDAIAVGDPVADEAAEFLASLS